MEYVIEVDEALNETMTRNANKYNMSVQSVILNDQNRSHAALFRSQNRTQVCVIYFSAFVDRRPCIAE